MTRRTFTLLTVFLLFALAGFRSSAPASQAPPPTQQAATAPLLDGLAKVKAKYDPENLFCVNQNIQPATNGEAAG